ncbi:MAG: S8 family serine peptidase [Verrucomicrobiota bacterium]
MKVPRLQKTFLILAAFVGLLGLSFLYWNNGYKADNPLLINSTQRPLPWEKYVPGASVTQSRELPQPDGTTKQAWLVREPSSGRLLRFVDHGTHLSAMLADRVLIPVSTPRQRTLVRQRLHEAGYAVLPARTPYLVIVQLAANELQAVPRALADLADLRDQGLMPEPDYLRFPAATPNDPLLDTGPAAPHSLIDSYEAWDTTTGSPEVVIAVLDSGVDLDHPDLAGNLFTHPGEIPANNIDDDGNGHVDDTHGWDYAGNDNLPEDTQGHGTAVASIAGARGNNDTGITGVNWQVSLLPLRIGSNSFATSDIVAALDYLYDLKLRRGVNITVSTNAYGGYDISQTEAAAVARQRDAGILFVAAAGNESTDTDALTHYPSGLEGDHIISVAASSSSDTLYNSSNFGPLSVDLAAPGEDIDVAAPGGSYTRRSGTSMATPFVAGVLALGAAKSPDRTPDALRTALFSSVDALPSLTTKVATGGRLNAAAFLAALTPDYVLRFTRPSTDTALAKPGTLAFSAGLSFSDAPAVPASALSWSVTPSANVVIEAVDDLSAHITFDDAGTYLVTATYASPLGNRIATRSITVGTQADEVTDGLVAHWAFDGSGMTATDSSGNARHGTLVGGATRETGVIGTAYRGLDTGAQHMSVPSLPSLPVLTYAGWVKVVSLGNAPFRFPRLIETTPWACLLAFVDIEGRLYNVRFTYDFSTTDPFWYTEHHTILPGRWYHIAVAYDSSDSANTPRIFINGQEQFVAQDSFDAGGLAQPVSDAATLGNSPAGDRGLNGLLDDVRLYDRMLSTDEVRRLATGAGLNQAPRISALANPVTDPQIAWQPQLTVADLESPQALTYLWSITDGPASPAIQQQASPTPSITFNQTGTYTLQLSVDDGAARTIEQFSVQVGTPTVSLLELSSDLLQVATHHCSLTATMAPTADAPVVVNFLLGGDAQSGIDYTLPATAFTFAAGQSQAVLPLSLITRQSGETRTLTLTLQPGGGYELGQSTSLTLNFEPYTFANWSGQGQAHGGTPAGWVPLADANTNGVTNLVEFALGLDPDAHNASHLLTLRMPRITQAPDGTMQLTYRRPSGVDPAPYVLGSSPSPTGSPFTPLVDQGQAAPNLDGTETVTASHPAPHSAGQTLHFFLRYEQPAP